MYDAALNLIPSQTVGPSTVTGTGKPLGRNRSYNAVVRVAGDAFAGGTCALTIEQSATLGGSYTAIAGPISLAELATIQGTTPRYEIPLALAGSVQGTPGTPSPQRLAFTTTLDYVRAVLTTGGTTPSFPLTTVVVEPIDNPTLMSGR